MIDEYKSGKDIYYISDRIAAKRDPEYKRVDSMIADRFEMFLNYYWGTGEKFPIKRITDLNEITENSVVICGEQTATFPSFAEVATKLQEKGLKLSQSLYDLSSRIYRAR
jgi:hypothetical protein